MAWIEVHQSLERHPKLLYAAELLKRPPALVAGHLVFLWCWALDGAPKGGPLAVRDVKAGAGWAGSATTFCSALTAAGFIDDTPDGLFLHDWMDYAGRLVEKRAANKRRMRDARAPHGAANVEDTCDARAGATVPYRTVPIKPYTQEELLEIQKSGTVNA